MLHYDAAAVYLIVTVWKFVTPARWPLQTYEDIFCYCFLRPESPETEAAMDLGASEVMESEVLYDCVICGQSGPSTEDRPTGLVVLLQASSGTAGPLHGQTLTA